MNTQVIFNLLRLEPPRAGLATKLDCVSRTINRICSSLSVNTPFSTLFFDRFICPNLSRSISFIQQSILRAAGVAHGTCVINFFHHLSGILD